MAVGENGKVPHGATKGANGQFIVPRSKRAKQQNTWMGRSFSIIARLLTWYMITTVVFRCPSSPELLTDKSPKVCRPYVEFRSRISPYVSPYYEKYATPYVESARPYYDVLDKQVIMPAKAYGEKYAAPRVAQAQAFGQAQWENSVQPQIYKLGLVAQQQYARNLAPYYDKVKDAVAPYYSIAEESALNTYYTSILPIYTALQQQGNHAYELSRDFVITTGIPTVQPYVEHAYTLSREFVVITAIPYVNWVGETGLIFLNRTVWPKIRILYGENVEPQLIRIGERLGRYRDGKKLQASIDEIESSISASSASSILSPSSSSTPIEETIAAETPQTSDATSTTAAPEDPPLSQREKAQKIVAEDLLVWQEKFAKAADQGNDELEERITEITDRSVKSQAQGVGEAYLVLLEETVTSQLKGLKGNIISIVKKLPNDKSEEDLNVAVRTAGMVIKEKARAVRSWRQTYDRDTNSLVSAAADETFRIIDHIRDLGLQEIGMRWAWTDGITHKDWAKYHALKDKFDEWRRDLEEVVISHPGLVAARVASEDIESRAMGIAEDASKELVRLKETGQWKISTADSSDDFSTKHMPPAMVEAVQKILEQASEASEFIAGTTEGTLESLSSSVVEAISSVVGTPQGTVESLLSVATEGAASLAGEASQSVIGTSQGTAESIVSIISESASSVTEQVSSSVGLKSPAVLENVSSSLSSAASSVGDAVPTEAISSVSEVASSLLSSGASVASEGISSASSLLSSVSPSATDTGSDKFWGGAMAQHVEAKQIFLDDPDDDSDEASYSNKIHSFASEVGDRFSDATRAVSEALMRPTSTQGSVESVTSLAAEQYSKAISAASVALYGTQMGTGESIASVASNRYSEAVAAASAVIYGTPIPVTESVASQISSAYGAALSNAADQYSKAMSIVSAQISGTPSPIHEEMFASVKSAYSDSKAAATSRFDAAMSAASSMVYGPPAGSLESISAVAASMLSEGLSMASAQFSSAKLALGATPTPVSQRLIAQAQNQYYAGIGLAHARYSEFLEAASSALLPTPTPVAQSLYDKASDNWEALITKASLQVYGAPTPLHESLYSQAGEYAAQVTESASAQYVAVKAIISELVIGREPDFTESVYQRLSSAYYTGAGAAVSSASSFASEIYASASSVVTSAFTPPAILESIMEKASEQVNEAVEAVSVQIYGTSKGTYEQATSAAASAYSSITSAASVKVYGTSTGYVEAASSSISDAFASAQKAINDAIYGTSTPVFDSATSFVADAYGSVTSVIGENVAAATSMVGDAYSNVQATYSSMVYGEEQQAVESAQERLREIVESARAKLAEYAAAAGAGAEEAAKFVSEGIEEYADSLRSKMETNSSTAKDEL